MAQGLLVIAAKVCWVAMLVRTVNSPALRTKPETDKYAALAELAGTQLQIRSGWSRK
jgi:hypothetical protein